MSIILVKKATPNNTGFPDPSDRAAVKVDILALHQHRITADQMRAKWRVPDLSSLTSWAYARKETKED
jgi:predicted transcriptional regulator